MGLIAITLFTLATINVLTKKAATISGIIFTVAFFTVFLVSEQLQSETQGYSEELAGRIGRSWESMPQPRHPFSLQIISPDRAAVFVNLGPHPPRLWPEDIELAHEMWLDLSAELGSKLHHRDVVGLALRKMHSMLHSPERQQVTSDLARELLERSGESPKPASKRLEGDTTTERVVKD